MTFNTNVLQCIMEPENILTCTIFTNFAVFSHSRYVLEIGLSAYTVVSINLKMAFSFRTCILI